MDNAPRILNAFDTDTIEMANALRGPAQGLGGDIGNAFVLSLSDGWTQHGIAGVRGACWDLMHLSADVVGGWDVHFAAMAVTVRTGAAG